MQDLHLELDPACGGRAAQIADAIRYAVRAGRLSAGHRLPPTRALASDLGVSRGVVVEAYERLSAEGFLVSRQGSGTRVAPRATPDGAADASADVDALLDAADVGPMPPAPLDVRYDLRPGIPDLSTFPRAAWLAALRRAVNTVPTAELGYPARAGAPRLRTELAAYLRRVRAVAAPPGQVVIAAGVAQAMAAVGRALVADGHRTLAVEDPSSLHQRPLMRGVGLTSVGVPVDDEGIDVAALARTDARAVLVTPAHQFPTGVVLSPGRRAALIEWARERDALIVEDDYDAEFRFDREPVGCLQALAPDRVVLAGSVSKSLAPALRLGWAVAPARLAAAVAELRATTDLGSPTLDQYALAELITDGQYDRHLRATRQRYRARRDAFVAELRTRLPGLSVRGVSAGLHLYLELPHGTDEARLVAAARAHSVAVTGVADMRLNPGPPALVVGFAAEPERKLAEAVRRLATALDDARSPWRHTA
jgi:GntR family transcriptional regulator/MocR family aminotransferase